MGYSLPFIQLLDSAFPTGAFSHSFGLETAVQEGRIRGVEELREWLKAYIHGNLSPMEGQGVHLAFHLFKAGEREEELWELDTRLTLSRLARESREGGCKIGKRYLYLVLELYPDCSLKKYASKIKEKACFGNPAIVHGGMCAHLELKAHTTVESYLYMSVNSLVQNAIRMFSMGQTEGQKLLLSLIQYIKEETQQILDHPVSLQELASRNVFQEIQSMRHEHLYSRLFMS